MNKKHFEENLKSLGESGLPKFKGLDLSTFNTIGWLIANHFSYLNTQLSGNELMLDVSNNGLDKVLIFKDDLIYEFKFDQSSNDNDIETIKIFKTKVTEIGVKYKNLAAVDDWININMQPKLDYLELNLEEFNDTFILNEKNCNYNIIEVYEKLKNMI
ncbi:hypothetical protein M3559_03515 [Staphylococcus equorum]|uniref:hypothetical protein n=1 Tax=Staphylococcus equorum TaxID=246432 RepID=UPI00204204A3|nr:hypothetical protein [Staphylococcus equorum]MCM3071720.1 hypothetical protein [Staphylococcus equorum]